MEILADMHIHSRFSVDGRADLLEMCAAAVEKGLECVCFVEHCDLNPGDDGFGFFDYERYSLAIDKARRAFEGRLIVLKGLEFGEPHLYPGEFETMRRKDFDYILGSVHWTLGHFAGEKILWEASPPERIFAVYYEELLRTVRFGGFDALAHFDFPKRYAGSAPFFPVMDEIARLLARSGIALEINTSPLRKGLNESSPDAPVLEKFLAAGGRRVTVGSDAHRSNEPGADFSHARNLLSRYPAASAGVYVKRKFKELGR
ncbi:MAG: histidinol-phosphatase HisJ family protein [Bacillota bacterium]